MDGLFDEKRIAFHGDGILLQGSQKIGSQALSGHSIRGAEGIRVQELDQSMELVCLSLVGCCP